MAEGKKWKYTLVVAAPNDPDATLRNLTAAGDAGWEVVGSYISGDRVTRFVCKQPKE